MIKKAIFTRTPINTHFHILLKFSSTSSTAQASSCLADLRTCIASLQACAHHRNLTTGKKLHSYLFINGFHSSPFSITSLINMYSKCNRIAEALLVFDSSTHDHNVFAYNAIIAGFIANELPKPAIEFYCRLRCTGAVPDKFTFPCVVRACSDVLDVLGVRKIHGLLFKLGLDFDLFIGSALVHAYLKFGFMEEAVEVFEELPVRDVVLWNAMINGYAQMGQFDMALEVFRRMGEERIVPSRFTVTGVLSVFAMMEDLNNGKAVHGLVVKRGYHSGIAVSNALIDMYGKCKFVEDALGIFDTMVEKDIFSWNSIICVHEQFGDHDGTLKLFVRMLRSGFQPDLVTVTTILPACSHLATLMQGKEIHGYMIINGLGKDGDDVYVNNAVLDMYAKCGSMREAHLVFDRMGYKDAASWNIMIMGYGMHGFGIEALDMFCRMIEVELKPDEVTFVGVLSACNHAGFVSQGRDFLAQMPLKYGVVPTIEHYTCVIDMLGRAGLVEEAYELVSTMPIDANPVVWRAVLAACRLHRNESLAKVAAERLFELEPEHCGSFVLMSNVYGAGGKYEEVSEVRHIMRQRNVRKTPGCSWIELSNGVHVFVTGDRTHPDDCFIYAELNSLTASLLDHGYVPDI
ncbi:pentatricopeptide repeat-containing protein At3g14730-like [Cornus florida]|uniref:pentatricopeptide repeat-containing protein At3g14730-like n=1 Tax=Cornus florida TaxID=4283 RepID=UPI00289AE47F|nr:pentatricopeptide repeat-containing protein At3g14730-like [Cornus florida]